MRIGIDEVRGLFLMVWTAWKPSIPGIMWSMKMMSGRLRSRYWIAASADSAASTAIS